MNDIFIVDAARTAIGSFGGTLSSTDPAKLAEKIISELLVRIRLEPDWIDEVILGNVLQAA